MAVLQWAATARLQGHYPETRKLFAIPLGGKRHIVTAMRMKATGSKKGVPDLMLPVARQGYHGLFVELKLPEYETRKDGGRSAEQLRWGLDLSEEGYKVAVAYGWQQAVAHLVGYLADRTNAWRTEQLVKR